MCARCARGRLDARRVEDVRSGADCDGFERFATNEDECRWGALAYYGRRCCRSANGAAPTKHVRRTAFRRCLLSSTIRAVREEKRGPLGDTSEEQHENKCHNARDGKLHDVWSVAADLHAVNHGNARLPAGRASKEAPARPRNPSRDDLRNERPSGRPPQGHSLVVSSRSVRPLGERRRRSADEARDQVGHRRRNRRGLPFRRGSLRPPQDLVADALQARGGPGSLPGMEHTKLPRR